MRKFSRLPLLVGVALPVIFTGASPGNAIEASLATSAIVVAQADVAVSQAEAEVVAAQAALEEAQASGGDVAAAQERLDAAQQALAAAQGQPAAEQPEPPPQAEAPADAGPPEAPPQRSEASQTPEPPAAEAPQQPETRTVDQTPSEQPPAEQPAPPQSQAQDSETQPPQANPPVAETPQAVEEPAQPPSAAEAPVTPQSPAPTATGEASTPEPEGQQSPSTTVEAPPPSQPSGPPEQAQPQAPAGEQPAQAKTQPPTEPPPEETAVESQLQAQGDQEAVENVRTLREKLRQEFARSAPASDTGEVQRGDGGEGGRRGNTDAGPDDPRRDARGGRDGGRRYRDQPSDEGEVVLDFGLGFVVELGDQLVIRNDGATETERFLDRASDANVEHFRGGYTRTVITRRDGTHIYTVRNQYGDIITRTRVAPDGRQAVLIDNRDFYRDGRRPRYGYYDRELPPLRVDIPREQYIVETSRYGRDDIRAALMAPPVEAVEHPYSLEEVRTSQRLRDKLRRVDLNTITFDFGSAAITPSQFEALAEVGTAVEDILARSSNEVFLVEGYTDAIGMPTANLILSDQRAEAIAVALSSNFAIPPENLVTQGYGEQYLKIPTEEAERENRRVTVRRITPLVAQSGLTAQ